MEENTYYENLSVQEVKLVKIKVENLRLRAYIGFKKWETEKLQEVIVSFSFRYNAARAIETDKEEDVLDYKAITKTIIRHIDRQSFHLLEKVADDVLQIIRQNPYTRDVVVRIEKPHALRFSDNVWVEINDQTCANEAIIGIGSNIEPEKNVHLALKKLSGTGRVGSRTAFIYTDPEKITEQDRFLNGAIVLQTKLCYDDLRQYLKSIETSMGRDRSGPKNGPRKIDLDVILFNGSITDNEVFEYKFLQDFLNELKPDTRFDFSSGN